MTSINRNPPTSNERLALAMARRQIRVIRYGNRLNLEAMDILNRTQEKLAAQVLIYANRLKGVGLDTATGQLLLRAYTKQVLNVRVPAWEKIAKLFKDDITALGLEEIDYFVRLFEEVSPYELTLATPKKADATRVLLNTPFEGKTLDQWIKNSQRADIERIVTRTKVALVQEARGKLKGDARHVKVEILSRVIGTKPMHGRDGVLNKAMNNIKAISYTSVNHAQNNASHQVAKSNPFVITEEYFIATLDTGTTPECRALDGEVYKLNEGPIPPLHMRCRSNRNPYLNVKNFSNRPIKTYTEKILAKEYAKKKGFLGVKTRADIPFGHKKAFDEYARKRARKLAGTVPAKIKYNDFLKMASKDFQDEALGPRRAALFRKGKIHVRDFVNDSGELLTIKDLQATGYDI